MSTDPQETQDNPPLEVVGTSAPSEASATSESGEPASAETAGGRGGGLRKVFWIAAFAIVLLAVAALGTTGYLGQREMRDRIVGLEGELAAAQEALALEQAALRAEQARADGLQTTMGRVNELSHELAESLRELQTLTGGAPPIGVAPDADAPAAAEAPSPVADPDETGALPLPEAEVEAAIGAVDVDAEGASFESEETVGSPPPSLEAPSPPDAAAVELSISEEAAPSILETPAVTSRALVESPGDELGDPLLELSEPSAGGAPADDGSEVVDDLPPVSAEPAPEGPDGPAPNDVAPAPPVPLWRQALEQLRGLAPSE